MPVEMPFDLLIVAALLALALLPVVRRVGSTLGRVVLCVLYGATLVAAFWLKAETRQRQSASREFLSKVPETSRPGGYVSSDNCRSCHPGQYDSWHRSYHRTMTQLPSRETVRGNFENVTLEFAGEKYHLERQGDEFWVDMVDPDWRYVETLKRASGQSGSLPGEEGAPRKKKRISMLTGSHHMHRAC